MPNVQQKTPDDGQRSCLKHVEFYNRINLDNWCVWLVIKKRKIFLSSLTLWNNSFCFSRDGTKWYFPSFCRTFKNFPSISDLLCEGSNFQNHAKPHSECSILALYFLNLSPLYWRKETSILNAAFVVAILNLISRVDLTLFVIILPKQLKYSTSFRCF